MSTPVPSSDYMPAYSSVDLHPTSDIKKPAGLKFLSQRTLALVPESMRQKITKDTINVPINKDTHETILALACQKGDLKAINELLEKGADPNVKYFDIDLFNRYAGKLPQSKEYDGWLYFFDPIARNRIYISQPPAPANFKNPLFLTSPLMKAMTRNDGIGSLVIDALLQSSIIKIDLNLRFWFEFDDIYKDCTPLIAAVCWQNAILVAKLLTFGADMTPNSIVYFKEHNYQTTEYRRAFDVAIKLSKKVPDLRDADANPTIKILMKEIYSTNSISGRVFEVMKHIPVKDIANIIVGYEVSDEDVTRRLGLYSVNLQGQHYWENIMELVRINHMETESLQEQAQTGGRILQSQSSQFTTLVTRFEAAMSSFERQKEEHDARNKALEKLVKDQDTQIKMLTTMLERLVTRIELQDSKPGQPMISLQQPVSPKLLNSSAHSKAMKKVLE